MRRALIALAVVAGIATLVLVGREAAGVLPRFTAWVDGLGAWGPIAFAAGYALAVAAFIPGSWLTLAAGATFGIAVGLVAVLAGASAGAVLSFVIARHLARGAVERRLSGDPRLAEIDRAVGDSGLRIMILLRLSPAFPFGLQNYALGLTRVRLRDYAIALLGIVPGSALYVYAGAVATEVAVAAGGAAPPRGAAYYTLLVVGLLATLAVTVVVTRIARRALAKEGARA